jgi:hypothetical protein
MRLSEAIRLGAMLKPQAFGRYFDQGRSCAMGAALEARGFCAASNDFPTQVSEEWWPWTRNGDARCPMLCAAWKRDWHERPDCFRAVIAHLNDSHKWTREQIADWVATVEPAETPDAQATTDDVRGGQRGELPHLTLRA